ncbi:MAG: nuclear transport factor 2 family protein [Leptothrix sp. (in: b-proteobacteria)]
MARPRMLEAALLATPDDTEAQFYEALQHADLEHLMAVWAEDDDIACVHPGGTRLLGSTAVRAGFEQLFGQGAIDTRPVQVRRVQTAHFAVHHVVEQVRMVTSQGTQIGHVLATNVYVKTLQGWRLLTHHASPGSGLELHDSGELPAVLH